MIPPDHPLLNRVIADKSTDPAGWYAARSAPPKIGASDAAKFSKVASVETYVRGILHNDWSGSVYADNGNTFEEAIALHAGITPSHRMFAHPDPELWRFVATPDGVNITPTGAVVLAECKVKHKPTKGPTLGERRQVVWQQYVTGADYTKWAWLELDPDTHQPTGEPRIILIDRDDDLLDQVLAVAHPVRAALEAADAFREENAL